jgi:hypothetical protein
VRWVVDRDHLINGSDLLLDRLDPESQLLHITNQLSALTLQFLCDTHVCPLQKWSRKLAESPVLVWWRLLPNAVFIAP